MALDHADVHLVRAGIQMIPADANVRWQDSTSSLGERSAYKKVWDRQAKDLDVASLAVAGHTDEATLDLSARAFIDQLRATVGIEPTDVVLEIGCGIARVGKPLSQECLHWFGSDISEGMLGHAAARLRERPNTTLVELATVGLQEFPRDAFDLVYCTIVFMHLFEWDRYRYVQEAFRVLRPGGRCYFDNFPLDSGHGWNVFTEGARYPLDRRPAHISMASTREELGIYLSKAGFTDVKVHDLPNELIAATGTKPT
jgi:SAM-dependent methyltransferase